MLKTQNHGNHEHPCSSFQRPKLCDNLDWISGTGQPGVNGFLGASFYGFGLVFVCVGFGCLLVVGFLWGFVGGFLFVCLGGGFLVFVRGWGFVFLHLILGRLCSRETQESISAVWCKTTPLWIQPHPVTTRTARGDNEFIRTQPLIQKANRKSSYETWDTKGIRNSILFTD